MNAIDEIHAIVPACPGVSAGSASHHTRAQAGHSTHPQSAAERLAQHWHKRRQEVLDAVSRAIRENRLEGADALTLADMVHNVAGTAGMFGESELGIRASALEHGLKHGDMTQRSALAENFLRAA